MNQFYQITKLYQIAHHYLTYLVYLPPKISPLQGFFHLTLLPLAILTVLATIPLVIV